MCKSKCFCSCFCPTTSGLDVLKSLDRGQAHGIHILVEINSRGCSRTSRFPRGKSWLLFYRYFLIAVSVFVMDVPLLCPPLLPPPPSFFCCPSCYCCSSALCGYPFASFLLPCCSSLGGRDATNVRAQVGGPVHQESLPRRAQDSAGPHAQASPSDPAGEIKKKGPRLASKYIQTRVCARASCDIYVMLSCTRLFEN